MVFKCLHDTPLGKVTLASDGECLTGLWFLGQKYYGGSILSEGKKASNKFSGDVITDENLTIFNDTKKWLDNYFTGKNPQISNLSLALNGSDFRMKVWKMLIDIPYGEVITYGEIAKKLASSSDKITTSSQNDKTANSIQDNKTRVSSQAVGGAVGHNPISIIVPCHRVIGAGGQLTGYAGGIERKIALLKLEGAKF